MVDWFYICWIDNLLQGIVHYISAPYWSLWGNWIGWEKCRATQKKCRWKGSKNWCPFMLGPLLFCFLKIFLLFCGFNSYWQSWSSCLKFFLVYQYYFLIRKLISCSPSSQGIVYSPTGFSCVSFAIWLMKKNATYCCYVSFAIWSTKCCARLETFA